MNFKRLAFGLTLTAAFGLLACGDDDSSSPVAPSTETTVSSSSVATAGDATPASSASVNSGEKAVSSGSFTMPEIDVGDMGQECSKEGEKKDGKVMGMDAKLICQNGVWVADTAAMKEGLKCTQEGATKDSTMMGMTVKLVCKNGQWDSDYSCTEEGATQEMDFMGMKMTMVCKNGEWTIDASGFGGEGFPNFADTTNTGYGRSDWDKWLSDTTRVVLD